MSAQPEAQRWAVIRRVGVGQCVATLRLPPFKAGDKVTADLTWQGTQPSETVESIRSALGRQVNEMARQLGVRIRLPLPQQPHQPGAPAPGLAPGAPAMPSDPQACPVSPSLAITEKDHAMTSATLETHPAQPPKRVTRYGVPLNGTQEQKLIAAIRSTNREVQRQPDGTYRVADNKEFTKAGSLAELEALALSFGLAPYETAAAPEHAFGAERDCGHAS